MKLYPQDDQYWNDQAEWEAAQKELEELKAKYPTPTTLTLEEELQSQLFDATIDYESTKKRLNEKLKSQKMIKELEDELRLYPRDDQHWDDRAQWKAAKKDLEELKNKPEFSLTEGDVAFILKCRTDDYIKPLKN
jgi:hypothetical protein